MQKTERKDIWFNSSDNIHKIQAHFYTNANVKPFCILQISHGMSEYMRRYEEFASFLAACGVVVCGNDHLGHGGSVATEDDLGFFTEKGGRRFVLQDLKQMGKIARTAFPGLPLVLLGHSMGSFFARRYAAMWPQDIDGLIISGTGGKNPLVNFGLALSSVIAKTNGARTRPPLLHNMAFGSYLAKVPNPATPHDWISRDSEVVAKYSADPLCTFHFTANGFHELLAVLKKVSGPAWAVQVRKDMPVLMIQGSADPVGNYGKGPNQVRRWMHAAGVKNLEYITYEGARHEVLNETNRADVYNDVLQFLKKWWSESGVE